MTSWNQNFIEKCKTYESKLKGNWQEEDLLRFASGKQIIEDIHHHFSASIKLLDFKKGIIRMMREKTTDQWRIIDNILGSHVQ